MVKSVNSEVAVQMYICQLGDFGQVALYYFLTGYINWYASGQHSFHKYRLSTSCGPGAKDTDW